MKLNKIALAVAVAGGAMAVHTAAQADSVFFPYVVYGDSVTTVINIIDNVPAGRPATRSYYNQAGVRDEAGNRLHYALIKKIGTNAAENSTTCTEDDLYLPSSPGDLQTIDLGDHFTGPDDLGVMFDDPGINNQWKVPKQTYALAWKAGQGQAVRGYLVVDNANRDEDDGDRYRHTLAGEAFIFDHTNGSAWGYRAVAQGGEGNEQGEYDFTYSLMIPGTAISFMPLEETTTRLFVTPLSAHLIVDHANGDPLGTTVGGNHKTASPDYGSFTTTVSLGVGADRQNTVYDRDENVFSSDQPRNVTCVGAVEVNGNSRIGLLTPGVAAADVPQGGWTRVYTNWPDGRPTTSGEEVVYDRETPIAHVIKLEFTAKGVFNGQPIDGVYNNSTQLSLISLPDLWTDSVMELFDWFHPNAGDDDNVDNEPANPTEG